ncbi:uncharacterized protein Dvar_51080 [Desulfosarcina variabilis str. Montpellier]|uniref:hypothetical protein n=1 Tax=Desulfosarcina variabilis TaxID=2300 RepID=UPI003AFB35F0
MGRLNTKDEREKTLQWAIELKAVAPKELESFSFTNIKNRFYDVLNSYFALSCLSRNKNESADLVVAANQHVFRVRTLVESTIEHSILEWNKKQNGSIPSELFNGNFFGKSKKQGTSVRMPLTTCQPTKLCASACYAHDVLDAAPLSLIRGVVNGLIAAFYEKGSSKDRSVIMGQMMKHTQRAVRASNNELAFLPAGFKRRPSIRFAHVGEMAPFPEFANALAQQIRSVSSGSVDCVVYTRHRKASEIDPELFVINFTLDASSDDRKAWVPEKARKTYSAFGGILADDVEINFLEHHRWVHTNPIGKGVICPATHPDTKIRTCDACECNLCFTHPNKPHGENQCN